MKPANPNPRQQPGTGNRLVPVALMLLPLLALSACGGGGGGGGGSTAPATARYALVVNQLNNSVSTYVVDPNTGRLEWVGKAATSTEPVAVATDPSGKYAYVTNFKTNNVSQYTVGSDGTLTAMGASAVGAGAQPTSIVVDPSGKYVYVTDSQNIAGGNSISEYTIGSTGALSTNGTLGVGTSPRSLVVAPSGKYAYVANSGDGNVQQLSIASDGTLASVGTVTAGTTPSSIAIDPSGSYLYVTDNIASGSVLEFSIATDGTLKSIGSATVGNSPYHITIDPSGKFVYVANFNGSNISEFSIASGGILKSIGTVPSGTNPEFVTVDPSGKYAYAPNYGDSTVSEFTIGSGGGLTPVSPGTAPSYSAPTSLAMTQGTAVQAVPKYAYVANSSSNDVSAYTIGSGGSLTQINCSTVTGGAGCNTAGGYSANFAAGNSAYSVAVDPTGKYVYVANSSSNDVSAYTVGSNGALTQINCGGGAGCSTATGLGADFAAGNGPNSVTVDPSGKYAYVANTFSNDVSAYTINSDGSLTQISCGAVGAPGCTGTSTPTNFAAGSGAYSVAIDPSGKYAYVANYNGGINPSTVSQYTIAANGGLTAMGVAQVGAGSGPSSVTVDSSGKYAYVANYGSNDVTAYSIGINGSLTQISCGAVGATGCTGTSLPTNFAAGNNPLSVTVDPSGKYAYVANYNGGDVSAYTIGSGGSLTRLDCATVTGGAGCDPAITANFAAGSAPSSVTVDPSGKYTYVANYMNNDVSAYSLGSDGSLTPIANFAAGKFPESIVTSDTWK